MDKKTIAIHQPDFMPWLGFFNKMVKADEFVVLDHVSNNPRDGFWVRRVKMAIQQKEQWITIPLVKPKEKVFVPINEMEVQEDSYASKKMLKSIRLNYSKAPFFEEGFELIEDFINDTEVLVAERNMKFINKIRQKLEIDTPMVYSSTMDCKNTSTEMLIEICRSLNADVYLVGGGATGYQEDELFEKAGIELQYLDFNQKEYSQVNNTEFIPGLSIVDVLMNCGIEQTKELINGQN
ncbi:MAG: WbqC family protein [Bacteroidetes bacterium]|nr:WbqC family protein [Bacteroidota bacterium]